MPHLRWEVVEAREVPEEMYVEWGGFNDSYLLVEKYGSIIQRIVDGDSGDSDKLDVLEGLEDAYSEGYCAGLRVGEVMEARRKKGANHES